MISTIEFFVTGDPKPQGSKTGRVVNGRVVMWEANKNVYQWRNLVKEKAQEIKQKKNWEHNQEPIQTVFQFYVPKPKTVQRLLPTTKPDLDKLVRSTMDALTFANIFTDDSFVVAILATKNYATTETPAGCHIVVRKSQTATDVARK